MKRKKNRIKKFDLDLVIHRIQDSYSLLYFLQLKILTVDYHKKNGS
jgi:hypothetical protein